MDTRRNYWVGICLTGLGAIILSPDALLFRLLDSSLWTAAFWRLLLMGLAVSAYLCLTRRRALIEDIRGLGPALLPAAVCMTLSNLGFVYALSNTSVAETLTIIATAPVFAAIFAALVGEVPPLRTWIAAGAITLGIGVIFDASFALDSWRGNLAAFGVAVAIAIYFVIGRVKKAGDLTPALALSALLSAGVAALATDNLTPPPGDWPILLVDGLIILPISLTLITLGPKRLPAAEVGLLMLLETALGPLWVWMALGETPSRAALIGGALIVGALIVHSLAAWRGQYERGRDG